MSGLQLEVHFRAWRGGFAPEGGGWGQWALLLVVGVGGLVGTVGWWGEMPAGLWAHVSVALESL